MYDRDSFIAGMLVGMNILRQNVGSKEVGTGTVNDVWTEDTRTYDFTVANATGNAVYEIDKDAGEFILSKDTPLDDDVLE